jgi:hypothetical protein
MSMAINVNVEADNLQAFLEKVDMKARAQKIIDALAERALEEIKNNYSKAEYGQAGEYMDFEKIGTVDEKTVSMSGPQAWYSEFGTGTYGEMQPHPLKDRFGLNPYNSGPTIRPASEKVSMKTDIPVGSLYWTYKAENGQIYYSQGVPAQKQVYNAGKTIEKELPEIVDKYMKGMFK